jgi:hypothetical protein
VTQALGEHFQFAFVNVVTGRIKLASLAHVLGSARKLYPTCSITLNALPDDPEPTEDIRLA